MSEPLLSLRELSVSYRGSAHPSPSAASLDVHPGEVVLVLGPSGCGKSTLALTCNGLVPRAIPARVSGDITLAGRSIREYSVATAAKHVAMVFQDADAQLVAGTVYEEVAFAPENFCESVAEVERRVETALREVNLWDRRDEAPELLSGGQRQRLAIADALAQGAQLLVLDEPTANLDPAAGRDIYRLIGRLVRKRQLGVLVVEHNVDEVLDITSQVVVLDHEGRVAVAGTPREIFCERVNELVALGVWLPTSTLVALRLRDQGWPIEKLPLGFADLQRLLGALPEPDSDGLAPGVRREQPIATDPALRVHNLSVTAGGRNVVDATSFALATGSITALLGRNGAGKTSLLRAVAGLTRAASGTVSVNGRVRSRRPRQNERDQIGFVFQNPEHQFLTASVRNELALELRHRRLSNLEVERLVDASLRRFDLENLADAHPFTLSGGQKRRLSVAAALISGARILILDEPTFGQDRDRAAELVAMLRELADAGTTILLATHDTQLAVEFADQLMVLDDGRLVAQGGPDAVVGSSAFAAAGIPLPPVAEIFRGLVHPVALRDLTRLRDIPRFAARASEAVDS